MNDRFRIGTLNIRNVTDRWDERRPLLLTEFAVLRPDLWGLQEVVYPVFEQDRVIAAAGTTPYEVRRGPAGRAEYGNAILVREPLAATLVPDSEADHLDLGLERSAMSVQASLPSGVSIRFVATHLHHVVAALAERDEQVRRILDWLADGPPTDATVVVGDFNAEPSEPAYARMRAAGFRSAMVEANGSDPEVTWPTGIVAPTMDTDGGPRCLDYVWLRGTIAARAARLCFDVAPIDDPTIFPSDHRGIVVEAEIGPRLGSRT